MTEKAPLQAGYGEPQYQGIHQPTAPPGPTTNTVFVPTQVTVTTVNQVRSQYPANITCPNCHSNVVTELSYENGAMTYLLAGGICFAGLWLGCCLIPFFAKTFKDIVHKCPNCKAVVGFHKRI